MRASNDFDHPDAVAVTTERRTAQANQLEQAFLPHSLTLLDIELG